jgi:hypothetical protein
MTKNETLALIKAVDALQASIDQLKLADLARRAELSGGFVFLMPQAE